LLILKNLTSVLTDTGLASSV